MFFLPWKDELPTRSTPWVTWLLIAANIGMFVWQLGYPSGAELPGIQRAVYSWGFIPADLSGASMARVPVERPVPAWMTLFTSMFMHGGIMHIAGNMWFLWIFGDNIEDEFGKPAFLGMYLLAGIGAAMLQFIAAPGSSTPMVGASGAIGGVMGAYILLHPKVQILSLLWIFYFIRFIRVPAYIFLGYWFLMQFLGGSTAAVGGQEGGVAYWAHVGGFLVGLGAAALLRLAGGLNEKEPDLTDWQTRDPDAGGFNLGELFGQLGGEEGDGQGEHPGAGRRVRDPQQPGTEDFELQQGDPQIEHLITENKYEEALSAARDKRLAAIDRNDLESARFYDEYVRFLRKKT